LMDAVSTRTGKARPKEQRYRWLLQRTTDLRASSRRLSEIIRANGSEVQVDAAYRELMHATEAVGVALDLWKD
jgi:hypothetical protein